MGSCMCRLKSVGVVPTHPPCDHGRGPRQTKSSRENDRLAKMHGRYGRSASNAIQIYSYFYSPRTLENYLWLFPCARFGAGFPGPSWVSCKILHHPRTKIKIRTHTGLHVAEPQGHPKSIWILIRMYFYRQPWRVGPNECYHGTQRHQLYSPRVFRKILECSFFHGNFDFCIIVPRIAHPSAPYACIWTPKMWWTQGPRTSRTSSSEPKLHRKMKILGFLRKSCGYTYWPRWVSWRYSFDPVRDG